MHLTLFDDAWSLRNCSLKASRRNKISCLIHLTPPHPSGSIPPINLAQEAGMELFDLKDLVSKFESFDEDGEGKLGIEQFETKLALTTS